MRRHSNRSPVLSFLPTLAIILCLLAFSLPLVGCATLDVGNPAPGVTPAEAQKDAAPLTMEQKLYLVRERMGSIAYDIEVAHHQGIVGDELYGQLSLRWTRAAKAFNAVLKSPPAGGLDPVDSALAGVQEAAAMLAKGGTASTLDAALTVFEKTLIAALRQGG